jgi:hypothetical protein
MPREISDEEYFMLQGKKQIADAVEPIWNDPALSPRAKALFKEKYPQAAIPDYDIEMRLNQRIDREKQLIIDHERNKAQAEQDRKFHETRSKIQNEYGFTDEGMVDLEKFMLEKNIGDYEVAAGYRVAKQPKQSDADADMGRDHYWDHAKQEGFAEVSADPEGWARKQILTAIRRDDEARKQRKF